MRADLARALSRSATQPSTRPNGSPRLFTLKRHLLARPPPRFPGQQRCSRSHRQSRRRAKGRGV
eukprot:1587948-Rhodomonas_salina.1